MTYMHTVLKHCYNNHPTVSNLKQCVNWSGLCALSKCNNTGVSITHYRYFRLSLSLLSDGTRATVLKNCSPLTIRRSLCHWRTMPGTNTYWISHPILQTPLRTFWHSQKTRKEFLTEPSQRNHGSTRLQKCMGCTYFEMKFTSLVTFNSTGISVTLSWSNRFHINYSRWLNEIEYELPFFVAVNPEHS